MKDISGNKSVRPVIGVISKDSEEETVKEFFQLFKTPWEFYVENRSYGVIVSTRDEIADVDTDLLLIYGCGERNIDVEDGIAVTSQHENMNVLYDDMEIPIYNSLSTFANAGKPILKVTGDHRVAGIEMERSRGSIIRIGYDLFQEVSYLLSTGQPVENAHIPTLELHIALMRRMILNKSIPLIEVPPVPAGYDFIACLTHDVDFIKLSHHKFDRTMFGFIYRSVVGVVFEALRRGIPWTRVMRNWKAAFSLPFIYLGLCKDFWLQFDRYLEIEKDIKSTFFFIPYKNHHGENVSGQHSRRRAAKYDINDARLFARHLVDRGYEIGVHGIDAWHSSEKGRQELKRISGINGDSKLGIRMHWLCFDESSPQLLDDAGFYYDSTFGYNEKAGYRAGTTQVYRPLNVKNLLELPLHIQDVALFSPGQMHLSENQAWDLCDRLFKNASLYGGVLTVLWHLRSLAPERLWGDFYIRLLEKMKELNAWFGTSFEIVSWFKKRRSVTFGDNGFSGGKAGMRLQCDSNESDMPMNVRVYRPCNPGNERSEIEKGYLDIPWDGERGQEIVLN
jgi:hypothetical protein